MADLPPVKIAELLKEANILVGLQKEDRESVVKALMQNMVATELVAKANISTVSRLLNDRESLGSTAIGDGVAIPHARIGFSEEPLMAFALIKNGSGFNALDGGSVQFVFMTLTPKNEAVLDDDDEPMGDDIHRTVLRAITTFVKQPIHRKALAGCKTAAEIMSVFVDYA